MASLFRSEEMALYQMILHSGIAYECVCALGEIGKIQFRDLNADLTKFQRKFVDEIRRCDEIERKLRYFHCEITSDGIPIADDSSENRSKAPQKYELNELEALIDRVEVDFRRVNEMARELKCNYMKLTELKHILRKIHGLNGKFGDEIAEYDDDDEDSASSSNISQGFDEIKSRPFGLCAGIISQDRVPSFERMLWRTLHGNNLYYHQTSLIIQPIEDCATGKVVNRSVFIAFCFGDEIQVRIEKICDGFHIDLRRFPIASTARRKLFMSLMKRIADLSLVLRQTSDHRRRLLISVANNLHKWSMQVCKIKAIYHAINQFDANAMRNFCIAEFWVPIINVGHVQSVLCGAAEAAAAKHSVPIAMPILNCMQTFDQPPPTHFVTNKFTKPFQMLIESYGVASYRELNPAPYAIVTIPFLFGIMFGDFGHGMLLTLFALWMIVWETSLAMQKNANNEVCANDFLNSFSLASHNLRFC